MSWFKRLSSGLSKTSSGISSGIADIFTKRRLDDAMLEELEELLILSDMGASTAGKIVAEFGEGKFDKEIAPDEVKTELASVIAKRLEPVALPLEIGKKNSHEPAKQSTQSIARESEQRFVGEKNSHESAKQSTQSTALEQSGDLSGIILPHIILVVGVNGNGKTTTIGKMAHNLKQNGYSVMLAAGDTFRAAAVEQLSVWAERAGCEIITGKEQADPAAVAYNALEQAKARGVDVLMIDTAGRLHNQKNLMEELKKIERVLQKLDADAPHSVVQVLDGTTGQNALAQVAAFKELVDVTGLVVTKLDGTAKAGIVVALAEKFGLPIHAIGVGEGIEDLQPFTADEFARSLVGA